MPIFEKYQLRPLSLDPIKPKIIKVLPYISTHHFFEFSPELFQQGSLTLPTH